MIKKLLYFFVILFYMTRAGSHTPDIAHTKAALVSGISQNDTSNLQDYNNKVRIHELEAKYQKEKKHCQLLEKNAEFRRKNMWLGMALMLVFFIMVIGYLFYIQFKLKVRQQQQESVLEEAINDLREQNKLLEQKLQASGKNNGPKS